MFALSPRGDAEWRVRVACTFAAFGNTLHGCKKKRWESFHDVEIVSHVHIENVEDAADVEDAAQVTQTQSWPTPG